MKGPYERLKYDFRRLWECPQCQAKVRTGGDCTSCLCKCEDEQGRAISMKLLIDETERVG